MAPSRSNFVIIGAFVLVAVISLVATLAVVAGRTGATDRYYTVYPNVAGLKYGTQVFYEGYQIGQVTAISPDRDSDQIRFKVELAVTRGWKIPADSTANSISSGLLAPQVIAINAGKSNAALKPGDTISAGHAADLFSTVTGAAVSVDRLTNQALLPLFGNLDKQVDAVGDLLDHDVRRLVGNANVAVAAAAQDLPPMLHDARVASAGLAQLSTRLNEAVTPDRLQALDRILANADHAVASLAHSSAALERITGDNAADLRIATRELRQTLENLSRHSDAITQNLDATARNLEELSRNVRDNPGLLLRNRPVRDALESDEGRR